ncbi:hypothetical protein [Bradyrhizobium prioriisuperbiae]|uniref:hypothetical protein n=1 Tax=Bradyrhizobium prioriisuperbiae TaxID=2854389 RepID=UPI0028EF89FA|nr:hypothetical protein [Bradyrhizobium prioritasuperba]
MLQLTPAQAQQQLIDTVIGLTQLSISHRAITIGSGAPELCVALQRRGFFRVVTSGTCPVARAQHAIGIIAGHHSHQALETLIEDISHYLDTAATIAVLIDTTENGCGLKVRSRLEQFGFRIDAGVRGQHGLLLSARRQDAALVAVAA